MIFLVKKITNKMTDRKQQIKDTKASYANLLKKVKKMEARQRMFELDVRHRQQDEEHRQRMADSTFPLYKKSSFPTLTQSMCNCLLVFSGSAPIYL